ncbi:tail fiber domain-containing protein [bacterium]|nr:tail fiber domain-containing protein [bacterium]
MPVTINGTSGITNVDGTAAAPALTGTDTDTGIFFPAANTLAFSTAGTEDARFDSSGNFGIGTSSPNQKLEIAATSPRIRLTDTDGGYAQIEGDNGNLFLVSDNGNTVANSTLKLGVDGSTMATLDTSGNLGLGVTPSAWVSNFKAFQVGTGGTFYGDYNNTTSYFGNNAYFNGTNWKYVSSSYALYAYQDRSAGKHVWAVAASGTAGNNITWTEAMTLDASGNLLVGNTNGTRRLTVESTVNTGAEVAQFKNSAATATNQFGAEFILTGDPNNSSNYFLLGTGNATTRILLRSNGNIANYQANDTNLSDRREKTNFAPAGEYLSKICAIPVQTFNYIDQNLEEDAGLTLGVVAQDVQAVAPELVMESNWGTKEEPKMRLSIYQTDLQYALMKALQELKAEFDAYKATHP